MGLKDYQINHILNGFKRHMHKDLRAIFKRKEIRKKINEELKELQMLGDKSKGDIKNEISEIEDIIRILDPGSGVGVSEEEILHIKLVVGATLRNFTSVVNKALSIYIGKEGLEREKAMVF